MTFKIGETYVSEDQYNTYKLIVKPEDMDTFVELLNTHNGIINKALERYKDYIRKNRSDDYYDNVIKCQGNITDNVEVIQNLFLQPICEGYAAMLDDLMVRHGWTMEKLIREHMKYPRFKITFHLNKLCK